MSKTKKTKAAPTTFYLEILYPNRFPSRSAIRAFLLGHEHKALRDAIDGALSFALENPDSRHLGGIVDDARRAGEALNHDLRVLAMAALSASDEVEVVEGCPVSFDVAEIERFRLALLLMAVADSNDPLENPLREGLFAHLGDETAAEGHEPQGLGQEGAR